MAEAKPKPNYGEGLNNDQLEENEVYTCRLSNQKVMVTCIREVTLIGRATLVIDAIIFNTYTGRYDPVIVWDYMLKL